MRQREERCIVTFRTTTGAMAMEQICKEQGVAGRLIPVPRTITAGCGMCWSAPMEERQTIEELVVAAHFDVDGIYSVVI